MRNQETKLADAIDRVGIITDLAKARDSKDISQAQMARELGISQAAVSEFESRRTDVKLSTLQKYARAIGMKIEVSLVES